MSGIPEVPEAERTCKNCMYAVGEQCNEFCSESDLAWEEDPEQRMDRAEGLIADLQAAVNGLAHTCDHLEDDRDYNVGLGATLTKERDEIGKQWHVMAGRIAHICQLLGVDFTCEEPETCEQVIERRSGELAAMREVVEKSARFLSIGVRVEAPGPHTASAMLVLDHALATEAGKPEADVIAAARIWAITPPLDCLRTVQDLKRAVERLQGKEKG